MPQGTLEVLLVGAKGLENSDFLCNMDPYVILTCRTQEKRSSVASGQGTAPNWNENFVFLISEGVSELTLKIMDSDVGSSDDFVGKSTIPLDAIFERGSISTMAYNVVDQDGEFRGEIRASLTFRPEERGDRGFDVDDLGGWKESEY